MLDWPTGGLNSAGWRAELRRDTGRGPAQAPVEQPAEASSMHARTRRLV